MLMEMQQLNFVELINAIARVAKPMHPDFNGVKNMSDAFKDTGIDSLDGIIIIIYCCQLYGIPEEVSKEWLPVTVQELYDLIMAHKTKEPASLEEAIKEIQ